MRYLTQVSLIFILAAGCSKLGSSQSSTAAPTTQQKAGQGNATAPKPPNDPAAQEKAKFVGTWIATDGEFQGVRMNPAAVKDTKWTFTADKVSYPVFGRVMKATYTIHPGTNPKSFDFKGPETAIQGIYEFKGDELRVCYAATERPMSFATGGTSQDTLMYVFRRANDSAPKK